MPIIRQYIIVCYDTRIKTNLGYKINYYPKNKDIIIYNVLIVNIKFIIFHPLSNVNFLPLNIKLNEYTLYPIKK